MGSYFDAMKDSFAAFKRQSFLPESETEELFRRYDEWQGNPRNTTWSQAITT